MKAPVPGVASLTSPATQQASPFAALFRTKLKGANDTGKLPAAGRPQDSARAQDAPTTTSNVPQYACQMLGFVVCSPIPPAQEIAIPAAGTAQDSAAPQDSGVVPGNSPSLSSALSPRGNVPAIVMVSQAPPNVTTLDPDPNPQAADRVTNQDAPSNSPSTEVSQQQDSANAPQSDRKAAASNSASLSRIQAFQATGAGLDVLNLQTSDVIQVPTNPSAQSPQSLASNSDSQFSSKLQTSLAAATPGSPVQMAAKTLAIGAASASVHGPLQAQTTNTSQPVPDVAAASKPQSKDTSSGSQGNDANTKPDHASNSFVSHTDGPGFGRSLETAATNSGNVHAAAPDLNMVAATARVPGEPRAVSVDAKPNAAGDAALSQAHPMPATSVADQPIVSGARLMDHPGQTEIRIEMQAELLGGVELRAHFSGGQIGASIAVEHHDAQMLLANELPALHSALIEKNLRVDTLSVSQGMPASMGGGPGGDASQRGFGQAPPKLVYGVPGETPLPVPDAPAEWADAGNTNARLSVRA
ncbi:MAG: flagellar hook-length control protein FliK [Acidobacteriia bacterium]|nr:flagellar hook-length control protein FliK [Terriglobia bacterium]